MRGVLSLRKAFSFLHGFLFENDHSFVPKELHTDATTIRNFLQKATREEVVNAYTKYHDAGDRIKQQVSVECLGRHLFLISTLFCDILRCWNVSISAEDFGFQKKRRKMWYTMERDFSDSTSDVCSGDMEICHDRSALWMKTPTVNPNQTC